MTAVAPRAPRPAASAAPASPDAGAPAPGVPAGDGPAGGAPAGRGPTGGGTAGRGPAGGGPGPARQATGLRPRLRAWQWPVAIVAVILLGATVIALLQPPSGSGLPLDPGSARPGGGEALADLLAQRGVRVIRTATAARTVAAARAPVTTVLVTSPGTLTGPQLAALSRLRTDLVLVAPGRQALAALAPAVTLAGAARVRTTGAACRLPAARLAGRADMGGSALLASRSVGQHCYPTAGPAGGWALIRYPAAGRVITVLGTGVPLTNQHLAQEGNAALGLDLLGASRRLVWLVPARPAAVAAPAPPPRQRSLLSLLPLAAYLVAAQLGVAALLAALWRMRRFGPLVAERIPVAVRAAETTEGHARLYQSRRSRDRAAATFRTAALGRLLPRLGLPRGAAPAAVAAELASRTGRTAPQIEALLYGPVPADDGALVRLAAELDALEGEVLTR